MGGRARAASSGGGDQMSTRFNNQVGPAHYHSASFALQEQVAHIKLRAKEAAATTDAKYALSFLDPSKAQWLQWNAGATAVAMITMVRAFHLFSLHLSF
jgi:hypothetical protein